MKALCTTASGGRGVAGAAAAAGGGRHVVMCAHDGLDAGKGFGRYDLGLVEGARDGGGGDVGLAGDPSARRKAEDAERVRWTEELARLVAEARLPLARLASEGAAPESVL